MKNKKKVKKALRLSPDKLKCLGCKTTVKLPTAKYCPECGMSFKTIELMTFRNPWKQQRLERLRGGKNPRWIESAAAMREYDMVHRCGHDLNQLISNRQHNGIVVRAVGAWATATDYYEKRRRRQVYYIVEAFHGSSKGFRTVHPVRFLPEVDDDGEPCTCPGSFGGEQLDAPDHIIDILWKADNNGGGFESEADALEVGRFMASIRLDNAVGIQVVKVIKLRTEAGDMLGRKVIKRYAAQKLLMMV